MIELRDFQQDIVDELRRGLMAGHLRQMLAMPTGSGKTVVASHIIHRAARNGHRSMFIVDRIELVEQAARHLEAIGLRVGVMQGENTSRRPDDEVIVASVQTVRSRGAPPAGFVVIDEAHILHKAHIELMQAWDRVPFIGLSATPLRPDLGKHFTNLVRGPTVAWLTEQGFLVPVRAFCPAAAKLQAVLAEVAIRRGEFVERDLERALNSKELVGDIITTWQEKAEGRPTLVFAVNIPHSKSIIDDFLAEGVSAAHLDAYTPKDARKEIIAGFRAGDILVLSSVNVLGIGFDVPDAACGILARPTLSEALHMQQQGRLIRPAEGKTDAIILDHAGNTIRFGLPHHFAVPDLGQGEHATASAKRKQARLVTCGSCDAVIEPDQRVCPSCGIDRPTRTSEVLYRDGQLVAYGVDAVEEPHTPQAKRRWYRAFLWNADLRGHKRGWAYYAYQAKFGEKPAWGWRADVGVEPTYEQARWIRSYYIRSAHRRSA